MNTTKLKARINNILGELINEVTVGQGSSEEEAIYQQSALTELTALLDTEIAKAKIEVLDKFEPFFKGDHSKCPLPQSCIGYQNAQSDFDNEKAILITSLADTESNKEGVEVNESN